MLRAMLAALFAVAVAGCVDQGPGPQPRKIEPSYIRSHLLEALPAATDGFTRFDVDVGDGAVTYVGNKVDKPRLSPGQTLTITHYWKVNRPLATKWRFFTLARGAPNTADFMNVGFSDMQVGHPPSAWKAGQIIEDVHPIVIRGDWSSPTAKLLVGFIEEGKHGPLDRIAVAGQRTEERAIVAATLEIDLSRAPPRPGTVHIPRASAEITIDGIGTEPNWQTAAVSPEFITAEGSADPIGKATAKLLWDDLNLYVLIQVLDTDIYSPYKQHDDELWKADCVELFIDADGNRRGYVELQVSPNNVTFDSWFATTRAQPGDVKWDSNMRTAVKVRGKADVAGDSGETGWDVEIAIPWAAVKGRDEQMKVTLPPKFGDQWRLNIVRVDKRSTGNAGMASSWNRISQSDYHALDRMLIAKFADATGSLAPTPEPTDSGSAGSGSAGDIELQAAGSASGSGSNAATPNAGSGSAGSAKPNAGSGSNAGSGAKPSAGSGSNAGSAAKPNAGSAANAGSSAKPNAGSANAGSAAKPNAGSGAKPGPTRMTPTPPTPPPTGSASGAVTPSK